MSQTCCEAHLLANTKANAGLAVPYPIPALAGTRKVVIGSMGKVMGGQYRGRERACLRWGGQTGGSLGLTGEQD